MWSPTPPLPDSPVISGPQPIGNRSRLWTDALSLSPSTPECPDTVLSGSTPIRCHQVVRRLRSDLWTVPVMPFVGPGCRRGPALSVSLHSTSTSMVPRSPWLLWRGRFWGVQAALFAECPSAEFFWCLLTIYMCLASVSQKWPGPISVFHIRRYLRTDLSH